MGIRQSKPHSSYLAIVRITDTPPIGPILLAISEPLPLACSDCSMQLSSEFIPPPPLTQSHTTSRTMTITVRSGATVQGILLSLLTALTRITLFRLYNGISLILTLACLTAGHSNLLARTRAQLVPPAAPAPPLAVYLHLVSAHL
jgi:hypothetical protein